MIAVDTNVLVRLVVADDPEQARRARKLFSGSDVMVNTTVLLQAAWVLSSAYRCDRARISAALRGVLGLDRVTSDAPAVVAQALDWFDAGIDLADALHVASAAHASQFATFDRQLVQRARRAGVPRVGAVPG